VPLVPPVPPVPLVDDVDGVVVVGVRGLDEQAAAPRRGTAASRRRGW
jgi:hypothetical protein